VVEAVLLVSSVACRVMSVVIDASTSDRAVSTEPYGASTWVAGRPAS
jgi:hypothetical protein